MAVRSKEIGAVSAVCRAVLVFLLDFVINVLWSLAALLIFAAALYNAEGRYFVNEELLDRMARSPEFLAISCLYNAFAIVLVYLFWKYIDKEDTGIIGLKREANSLKLFMLGLAGGTIEIVLIMLLSLGAGILWFESFGWEVFSAAEILKSILYGIPAFLLVGFGEEAVFRGYVQKRLMVSMGNNRALLISSLIFMAAHLFTYDKLLDLVDVALGGVVLGYLYILTESLYLPAAYHFIYDLIQVSIVKLQDYEHFKGAALFIFNNTGDIVIAGVNYGNAVEVSFVAVEIAVLLLLYIFRGNIRKLALN